MSSEQLDDVLLETEQIKSGNERIGFGRRLGAYMLDVLAMIVLGSIIGVLVGDQLALIFFQDQIAQYEVMSDQFSHIDFDFMGLMMGILEIMAGISITGLLLFIMEGAFGQSFGKIILKIINTNVDGTHADAGKLWLRSLLKYGSTMLSLLGGAIGVILLGWIATLWSIVIFIGFFLVFMDNKQTIHDMIAKTVVSRK